MTTEENDPTPFIQAMAAGLRSLPVVLAKKERK